MKFRELRRIKQAATPQECEAVLAIMIGHALIGVATAAQILASSTIPGFFETMCNAA